MSALLQIRDESALGKLLASFWFRVPGKRTTVRELIAARVRHEVGSFNAGDAPTFRGLVMPEGAEEVLNGYKLRAHRQIDSERQVGRALEAFEHNGFFVIVNDRQVEDLDEVVEVSDATTVSFVKLVPLVGG
jgi:hypothetical protein